MNNQINIIKNVFFTQIFNRIIFHSTLILTRWYTLVRNYRSKLHPSIGWCDSVSCVSAMRACFTDIMRILPTMPTSATVCYIPFREDPMIDIMLFRQKLCRYT